MLLLKLLIGLKPLTVDTRIMIAIMDAIANARLYFIGMFPLGIDSVQSFRAMMLRDQSRVGCRFAMLIIVHCLAQRIWGEEGNAPELCGTWNAYRMKVRQLLKVVTSIRIWNWDLNNFKILDLWSKTNFFSEQNYRYWDNFYVFLIIRTYFVKLRDDFHATKLPMELSTITNVRLFERRELFKWLQITGKVMTSENQRKRITKWDRKCPDWQNWMRSVVTNNVMIYRECTIERNV